MIQFSYHRAIAGLLFALAATAACAHAQTDTAAADAAYVPTLTFDVVSIHESKDDPVRGYRMGGPNSAHSSIVSLTNYRATDLIGIAYGVDARNIFGGPDWASFTRYYLSAKSDTAADDILAKLTDKQGRKEKQHMLQLMLADRFQLKLHPVVRDATVYDLVVAKGGPKLHESKPDDAGTKYANKPTVSEHCDQKGCRIEAKHYGISVLVNMLGGQLPTRATDKTELTGTYDFTLQWASESFRGPAEENDYPPLFTAIKEQLGLELKPVKGTIDTLVIDHIEKPSEN